MRIVAADNRCEGGRQGNAIVQRTDGSGRLEGREMTEGTYSRHARCSGINFDLLNVTLWGTSVLNLKAKLDIHQTLH